MDQRKTKKTFLLVGIFLTLSVLFVFKYINFSLNIIEDFLKIVGISRNMLYINLLLPLGLSFYSFQAVSYLLDIYNGVLQPERNFGKYALYLSFFPKLISGPIERADHLLLQISDPKPFEYQRFIAGLLRIMWGFFKKLVIAERLGVLVGIVFSNPTDFSAGQSLLAVLAFSLQIYIDFSAYCDIAIGAASLFGIDLVENFNLPYLSRSVTEFWRRWHISLSNWLRDYLFIPLNFAARRKNMKIWMPVNILIVFLVSGIWHGANYTFIIWGALHGLYQAIEAVTLKWRSRLEKRYVKGLKGFFLKAAQIMVTFGLVCFAWIFFRAENVHVADAILRNIFSIQKPFQRTLLDFTNPGFLLADFWILAISLIIFILFEIAGQKGNLFFRSQTWPLPVRWTAYLGLIFTVILFGYFGMFKASDFIYAGF